MARSHVLDAAGRRAGCTVVLGCTELEAFAGFLIGTGSERTYWFVVLGVLVPPVPASAPATARPINGVKSGMRFVGFPKAGSGGTPRHSSFPRLAGFWQSSVCALVVIGQIASRVAPIRPGLKAEPTL
jgi:hypothetical protein